jgi:hypothetical protein
MVFVPRLFVQPVLMASDVNDGRVWLVRLTGTEN